MNFHMLQRQEATNGPAFEAYMPHGAKKKVLLWDFQGVEDNSQEAGESKCLVNKCLPG